MTGIVGRTTFNLTFFGEAAHAGTTTVEQRRDALQGAAAFIILVHSIVNEEFPNLKEFCSNSIL